MSDRTRNRWFALGALLILWVGGFYLYGNAVCVPEKHTTSFCPSWVAMGMLIGLQGWCATVLVGIAVFNTWIFFAYRRSGPHPKGEPE